MQIGYARVSKQHDQDTAAQLRALKESGVERVFTELASGGRWDRPELHRMLDQLRADDVVVVWKLDRLSRSLKDLLHLMELLGERGAGFRSLTEAIDTTTPAGRMMMQMVGAFAEFERAMIRERTRAGLEQARLEGRVGGRKRKLRPHQEQDIRETVKSGRRTAAQCARLFGVHPSRATAKSKTTLHLISYQRGAAANLLHTSARFQADWNCNLAFARKLKGESRLCGCPASQHHHPAPPALVGP